MILSCPVSVEHIVMFHFTKILIPTLLLAINVLKLQRRSTKKVLTLLSFSGLKHVL